MKNRKIPFLTIVRKSAESETLVVFNIRMNSIHRFLDVKYCSQIDFVSLNARLHIQQYAEIKTK